MIRVDKGEEPRAWTAHRMTPGARYESKPELRQALLEEQGYLCAYCMAIIDEDNSKVEHIIPRSTFPDLQMTYTNMLICCTGDTDAIHHCDTIKDDAVYTLNVFSDAFINTISYRTRDAKILSSNNAYNLEMENMLNLNHRRLKANRLATLDGLIREMPRRTSWTKSQVEAILNNWKTKDNTGKFKAYAGIVIWYLSRKLNQL